MERSCARCCDDPGRRDQDVHATVGHARRSRDGSGAGGAGRWSKKLSKITNSVSILNDRTNNHQILHPKPITTCSLKKTNQHTILTSVLFGVRPVCNIKLRKLARVTLHNATHGHCAPGSRLPAASAFTILTGSADCWSAHEVNTIGSGYGH